MAALLTLYVIKNQLSNVKNLLNAISELNGVITVLRETLTLNVTATLVPLYHERLTFSNLENKY